jgi:sulfoxide reductase heme-binding subunit YedZ
MLAVTGGKAMWYLTRGTGMMALLLLTASMFLGIVAVKRWQSSRWPRFVTAALHRNLSLLSVIFVAVHVATTVIDGFAPIGWLDAVIPFRSPYRPLWLGLGAVSTDFLIALVGTSLLRGRLGYRAWRAVHWAAYACWPVALLHGMGTGTDIRLGWGTALNLLCLVAVLGAVWWRLASAWGLQAGELHAAGLPRGHGAVVLGTVASIITPVVVIVWLVMGPLQPGWAKRAGTPTAHRSVAPASTATAVSSPGRGGPSAVTGAAAGFSPASASTTPAPPSDPSLSSTAHLTGILSQTPAADGQTSVTIDAKLTVPSRMRMVIVLKGDALAGGGITMRSSQVTIGMPADPSEYRGTVSTLVGQRLTLALSGPSHDPLVMVVQLTITGSAVGGTIEKVP